jgi:signal transduction histidine kinase/ActR/RegA family two-component response regulator
VSVSKAPAPRSHPWLRRSIPWIGGALIAVIAATAAYDIVRSYQLVVADTGRELDSQARVVAEQTSRSVQGADLVLRHIARQFKEGVLPTDGKELSAYLKTQAIGLVQLEGFAIIDAAGSGRAASFVDTKPVPDPDLSTRTYFKALRDDQTGAVFVDQALRSEFDLRWVFPIARRLETATGEFAGVVVARGRIDYFHQFYRDMRLDPGTNITLMHQNGSLVARFPQAEFALGKHYPTFNEVISSAMVRDRLPIRATSPVDGVERFASVQLVGDYPLAVVVSRDVDVALAAWRTQSVATAFRTLALGALAGLLLVLVMRQFARLHRAHESLETARERFSLAVTGADQGIWDINFTAGTAFISERGREIVGMPAGPEKIPLDEFRTALKVHPEDRARRKAALHAHLAGALPEYESEYRVLQPDGVYRWVRVHGVCVRDENGQPCRMAGSVSDIDARKRTEAERDRLAGQLLQAKKLEAMGTLAGGIAHDFNNILAAILGYGEMAQKDSVEGTPMRRHIDAAMSAGMRAKALVERILAFSRSGMSERAPVHVQSVVAEALDLIEASLPTGVQMERLLAVGDAAILGDPTQVHQVVMNLCTNAVQAMPLGGVLTVALELEELTGQQCATCNLPNGKYVRLRVCDTGIGIAAPLLERIFDPFFTTKEVGAGTGLGLSLVHGIVSDLGGGIHVDSTPGAGSTFDVFLPWRSSIALRKQLEDPIPGGRGETVLLVDDEEALVALGEEMIAELGYEPVGFKSSTAAIAAFRSAPERFNAVLSDEAMPEMTGSQLASEIRAIRPDIPIVLMSGFVTPELATRARNAGVVDVLAKPLVARDIARALASALRSELHPSVSTAAT